jgi:hypothetical protein
MIKLANGHSAQSLSDKAAAAETSKGPKSPTTTKKALKNFLSFFIFKLLSYKIAAIKTISAINTHKSNATGTISLFINFNLVNKNCT